MGLFGGIGKALKGVDWGKVMSHAQSAGAIAHGDYGTAAQIQDLRRQRLDERDQAEASSRQHEQMIAAAVQAGIPEQQARALPPQQLAGVLADRMKPQGEEFSYFDDNAGNRWRQNTRTGQVDANPSFIDRNPRTFFDPSQNRVVTVPNSYAGGQPASPQGGQVSDGATATNPQTGERVVFRNGQWVPMGGGAGNGAATFPGFQRLPGGGQFRLP